MGIINPKDQKLACDAGIHLLRRCSRCGSYLNPKVWYEPCPPRADPLNTNRLIFGDFAIRVYHHFGWKPRGQRHVIPGLSDDRRFSGVVWATKLVSQLARRIFQYVAPRDGEPHGLMG